MFYYGILNIGMSLMVSLFTKSHEYNFQEFPLMIENFLHRQADNIVLFTVGVALFAAMEAISITKNDITQSEKRIIDELACRIQNIKGLPTEPHHAVQQDRWWMGKLFR